MWLTLVLAASAADTQYVQASTLNLRAEPAPDAAVRKVLDINSEVEVLSLEGAFAHVRAEGKEGWVAVDFLAPQRVTVEEAMSRAKISADPADRLSWVQRAAAIRPDDEVLIELEAAYRAIGDQPAADKVARERKWPRALLLVAADGPPEIELSSGDPEAADPSGVGVAPKDFERRFGFSINAKGWLLPDRGPAVEAQLAGARAEDVSPCGTGWGTVGYVAAGLAPDRVPVAFTREEPPASWRRANAEPLQVPEAKAKEVADERLAKLTKGAESRTWIVPTPDGWLVRVARGDSPGIPETAKWHYVDLLVTASGTKVLADTDYESLFGEPGKLLAARDVNGDGELDVVLETACGRMVTTLAGDDLAITAGRCCD